MKSDTSQKEVRRLRAFEVDSFGAALDALAHYKANYYADIILDVRMPQMFEHARKIRKQNGKTQIGFLAAYDIYQKEAQVVFPNLKLVCFMTKPMSIA